MRKYAIAVVILIAALLAGCASMDIQMTPDRIYMQAQKAYLNTWNPYHKAWLALPDTDPRKAEWVKKYHPVFVAAGEALIDWGENPGDVTLESIFDRALEDAEDVLIELAIKKGG